MIIGDEKPRSLSDNLYTTALIAALSSITTQSYRHHQITKYKAINSNIKLNFTDIILKKLTIQRKNQEFIVDISIIRDITDSETFTDLEKKIYNLGYRRFIR